MATLSNGSTTITPTLRLTASATVTSRNKIHELLGGGVAVTFGAAPLRTGTLELFFDTETAADAAETFHRDGFVFAITDPDNPSLNMNYVVAGSIERTLDPETRRRWLLKIDIQEVTP